jgi:hypothetical protein
MDPHVIWACFPQIGLLLGLPPGGPSVGGLDSGVAVRTRESALTSIAVEAVV